MKNLIKASLIAAAFVFVAGCANEPCGCAPVKPECGCAVHHCKDKCHHHHHRCGKLGPEKEKCDCAK